MIVQEELSIICDRCRCSCTDCQTPATPLQKSEMFFRLDAVCNRCVRFVSSARTEVSSHHAEVSPRPLSRVGVSRITWVQSETVSLCFHVWKREVRELLVSRASVESVTLTVGVSVWSPLCWTVPSGEAATARHKRKVRKDDPEGTWAETTNFTANIRHNIWSCAGFLNEGIQKTCFSNFWNYNFSIVYKCGENCFYLTDRLTCSKYRIGPNTRPPWL